MQPVKIYGSSGFVAPLHQRPGGRRQDFDLWLDGDSDASIFHTLPGLTFRNSLDGAKTIEIGRKASELFGGTELFDFVNKNLLFNRFKSDLHYRFMCDTIEYIQTGKRSMSIHTWQQLLVSPNGSLTKKVHTKTAYSMKSDCYRNISVMQWLSHEGGLLDLVISLYIIFGKY